MKKWAVYRGIKDGNIFWSSFDTGRDERKLDDGTVAYDILVVCDTAEECKEEYRKRMPR